MLYLPPMDMRPDCIARALGYGQDFVVVVQPHQHIHLDKDGVKLHDPCGSFLSELGIFLRRAALGVYLQSTPPNALWEERGIRFMKAAKGAAAAASKQEDAALNACDLVLGLQSSTGASTAAAVQDQLQLAEQAAEAAANAEASALSHTAKARAAAAKISGGMSKELKDLLGSADEFLETAKAAAAAARELVKAGKAAVHEGEQAVAVEEAGALGVRGDQHGSSSRGEVAGIDAGEVAGIESGEEGEIQAGREGTEGCRVQPRGRILSSGGGSGRRVEDAFDAARFAEGHSDPPAAVAGGNGNAGTGAGAGFNEAAPGIEVVPAAVINNEMITEDPEEALRAGTSTAAVIAAAVTAAAVTAAATAATATGTEGALTAAGDAVTAATAGEVAAAPAGAVEGPTETNVSRPGSPQFFMTGPAAGYHMGGIITSPGTPAVEGAPAAAALGTATPGTDGARAGAAAAGAAGAQGVSVLVLLVLREYQ